MIARAPGMQRRSKTVSLYAMSLCIKNKSEIPSKKEMVLLQNSRPKVLEKRLVL